MLNLIKKLFGLQEAPEDIRRGYLFKAGQVGYWRGHRGVVTRVYVGRLFQMLIINWDDFNAVMDEKEQINPTMSRGLPYFTPIGAPIVSKKVFVSKDYFIPESELNK